MTSEVGDDVGDEHLLMHVLMSSVHMSMLSVGDCVDCQQACDVPL